MNSLDTLQVITLLGFVGMLGACVMAWRPASKTGRFYIVPVAIYGLLGTAYYIAVVFFYAYTTGDARMIGSVVLRLHSVILGTSYVLLYVWTRGQK